MRDGEQRESGADPVELAPGAAMKPELRRAAMSHNFHISPQDLRAVPGPERFHCCFLGGETASEMNGGSPSSQAIRDLALGEDATKKSVAESSHCCFDAGNVRGVQAEADDVRHGRNDTAAA